MSAAGDAGRSEAVSLLLIDEAAFIENIGEIWASAQQTLATGEYTYLTITNDDVYATEEKEESREN